MQQACEMVMDILRERDQGGFGDRNEYGSRIGGGIDVRTLLVLCCGNGKNSFSCPLIPLFHLFTGVFFYCGIYTLEQLP